MSPADHSNRRVRRRRRAWSAASAMLLRGATEAGVEDRLAMLTGATSGQAGQRRAAEGQRAGAAARKRARTCSGACFASMGNLNLLFEQADTTLTPTQFFGISAHHGGGRACSFRCLPACTPASCCRWALLLAVLAAGLADVAPPQPIATSSPSNCPTRLELIARALRAGHSLASGFNLVADEMQAADRQGIRPRVRRAEPRHPAGRGARQPDRPRCRTSTCSSSPRPSILQRQTGGDLAEILDKIGYLVRERFKIWGTGAGAHRRRPAVGHRAVGLAAGAVRGRLSAESRLRDAAVHRSDGPARCWPAAIVMQLLGAIVIRKIVNIKV